MGRQRAALILAGASLLLILCEDGGCGGGRGRSCPFAGGAKAAAFVPPLPAWRHLRCRPCGGDDGALRAGGAGDLHTGYEWLARQKADAEEAAAGGPGITGEISWMDLAGEDADGATSAASASSPAAPAALEELPLYPLGAVHLPSVTAVQILNNSEPRNVRMAQDLEASLHGGLFVTVLRAADTGRIATVGTLMRLDGTEETRNYGGELLGIRVRCRAEGLVRVEGIVNPECWSGEERLRRSDEYLMARVSRFVVGGRSGEGEEGNGEARTGTVARLAADYAAVRSFYIDRDGVAARDLPPFAVDAVRNNLPPLREADFDRSVNSFWRAAEVWQTLCNTVREARRSDLQSEVNEITIGAAMRKGGPLKLPVHRSDVPPDVQARLNKMEEDAAGNFVALGMDPIINFQAMLSCGGGLDRRIEHLGNLVSRERGRIEAKQQLKGLFDGTSAASATAGDVAAPDSGVFNTTNTTSMFQ